MLNKHNLSLASLASKETSRFTLNGILVTPTETVETDGHQLCTVSMQKTDTEAVPSPTGVDFAAVADWKPFILPAGEALDIAKALPKKSTIPILQNAFIGSKTDVNGTAQIAVTNLDQFRVFNPRKLEGNFPDWKRVIPKPEENPPALCVSIDAALLARVLKQVESFRGDVRQPFCRMYFWGDKKESGVLLCNNAIRIDADNDTGQHFTGVVMPGRDHGASYPEACLDEHGKRTDKPTGAPADETPADSVPLGCATAEDNDADDSQMCVHGDPDAPEETDETPADSAAPAYGCAAPEDVAEYENLSLERIETRYREGLVSEAGLAAYLDSWNANPGHLTVAYWQDGAIRQRERFAPATPAAAPTPAPKSAAPKPAAGTFHCPIAECCGTSANRQGVVAHLRMTHKITDKSERDSLMAGM